MTAGRAAPRVTSTGGSSAPPGCCCGTRGAVLLQHRALWSHHGGTWGIRGGAATAGDAPSRPRARGRRGGGPRARRYGVAGGHVDDHGGWSYTTVVGRAAVAFTARTSAESIAVRLGPGRRVGRAPAAPRLRGDLGTRFAFSSTGPWPRLPGVGRLIVVEGLDGAGKRTLSDGLAGGTVRARRPVRPPATRSRATARTSTPTSPATPSTDASVISRRRCTGWPSCSHSTAAPPPTGPPPPPCATTTPSSSTVTSPPTRRTGRPGCSSTPTASWWPGYGELEVGRFAVPVPDLQLLLQVPRAVAAERAAHRERTEAGRERDAYESDGGLQERTGAVYSAARGRGVALPLDGARRDGATVLGYTALADDLVG